MFSSIFIPTLLITENSFGLEKLTACSLSVIQVMLFAYYKSIAGIWLIVLKSIADLRLLSSLFSEFFVMHVRKLPVPTSSVIPLFQEFGFKYIYSFSNFHGRERFGLQMMTIYMYYI